VVQYLLRAVIDPAVIWSTCLILLLFFEQIRRRLLLPFVVITLLGSNSLIAYLAALPLERYGTNNFTYGDQTQLGKLNCQDYKGVIALGGVIPNEDFNPKYGVQITDGVERITQPVALYQQCPNLDLIFTSFGPARAVGIGEAELAQRFWLSVGVEKGDIKIENKSINTYENAINTKALLGSKDRYLLITSAAHMRRAHTTFTKVGLKVDPISVDYLWSQSPKFYDFTPLHNLQSWRSISHEYIGIAYYHLVKF
jgi:uncharacterized SAM-binding protein YcdF (DUF218 family)